MKVSLYKIRDKLRVIANYIALFFYLSIIGTLYVKIGKLNVNYTLVFLFCFILQ